LSCTIIVSDASAWMEPYHDRMPVLLQEADFDARLHLAPKRSSRRQKRRCANGPCRLASIALASVTMIQPLSNRPENFGVSPAPLRSAGAGLYSAAKRVA
jgi:putative SOS response-associated peptidase YedK